MPYVPAHTNVVGSFSQNDPSTLWTHLESNPFATPQSSTTSTVVSRASAKSETQDGEYSIQFPTFRKPTGYQRNVMRFEDIGGGYDFRFLTGTSSRWHYWGSDGRHSSLLRSNSGPVSLVLGGVTVSAALANRTITEARLKLADTKVNLGVALGEARTTINMIARRIRQFAQIYRAMRRGNFSLARWYLFGGRQRPVVGSSAANLWLEWRYGWSPLIRDVVNGVELLQRGLREEDLLFNVTRTITQPLNPATFVTTPDSRSKIVHEGEAWESCRVELWGAITADIAHLNSLGLINPLSLAWELVTLSFVIDWLIPIGDWLESLTATVGITFVGGYRLNRVYADVTGTLINRNGDVLSGKLPKCRNRVSGMQRFSYTSWPWSLPYWVSPLSTANLTSAVALLKQRS